jgi:N-acetyl sugar amidotransferase
MPKPYQVCKRCILDTKDDPIISFDGEGICNHCRTYERRAKAEVFQGEEGKKRLDAIVAEIKAYSKGKPYDSIMGVSGGVDSTYLAWQAKQLGLRPLLVHFDNGWNSELAVHNIENIVNKLGFDLFTYVVNWEEFKDLQLAYLKASVLDIEIPTDHGFFAMMYKIASEKGIKYILSGHNLVTEGILPAYMRWSKLDLLNIRSIHKKFGTRPLKTFPTLGFLKYNYYLRVKKFVQVAPLNFMHYDKNEAKELITRELGWRDYGGKHYESIFTRFYQGYILPVKFGVDKRKAHVSTLINSGQMTREEALQAIAEPIYNLEQLAIDKEYVIKKFGLTSESFEKIMAAPVRQHEEFPTYVKRHYVWNEKFFTSIRPFTRAAKRILGKA